VDLGSVFFYFPQHWALSIFTIIHQGAVALPNGAFYTIYVYSPEGDSATALAEFVLFECSCC